MLPAAVHGAHHDDGDAPVLGAPLDATRDVEAMKLRQHGVEDDEVGEVILHQAEREKAAIGLDDAVPFLREKALEELADVLFVVDDEDQLAAAHRHGVGRGGGADAELVGQVGDAGYFLADGAELAGGNLRVLGRRLHGVVENDRLARRRGLQAWTHRPGRRRWGHTVAGWNGRGRPRGCRSRRRRPRLGGALRGGGGRGGRSACRRGGRSRGRGRSRRGDGGRDGAEAQVAQRLLGDTRSEIVRLAARLAVVGGGDGARERRVHGDVRVDLLAGDELELVDDPLVAGVRHGQEDAVPAHEDGEDAMGLSDLARHHVEVLQHDGHLGEIDPGHAVLLRQRAQRLDLVEGAFVHEHRGEGGRGSGASL